MVVRQRKRSQKVVEADKPLLERIEPIKSEHPAWGYRRVWSYLKYRLDIPVGKNRIYRILKENRLLAMNRRKLKALRSSRYSKPSTDTPNELWGIDMTKVKVDSWGWLYLVVVKDWGSKKIVGWSLSTTSPETGLMHWNKPSTTSSLKASVSMDRYDWSVTTVANQALQTLWPHAVCWA
jgi:transposase InsO family protein